MNQDAADARTIMPKRDIIRLKVPDIPFVGLGNLFVFVGVFSEKSGKEPSSMTVFFVSEASADVEAVLVEIFSSSFAFTLTNCSVSCSTEEVPILVAFIKSWAALELLFAKNKPLPATTV